MGTESFSDIISILFCQSFYDFAYIESVVILALAITFADCIVVDKLFVHRLGVELLADEYKGSFLKAGNTVDEDGSETCLFDFVTVSARGSSAESQSISVFL